MDPGKWPPSPNPTPLSRNPHFLLPIALPLPRPAIPSSCAVPTQPSPTPAPSTRHPPFSSSWTVCGSWAASSRCRWSLGRGCCWRCLNMPMPLLLAPSSATVKRRGEPRGCQGGLGTGTGQGLIPAAPAPYFPRRYLSCSGEFLFKEKSKCPPLPASKSHTYS